MPPHDTKPLPTPDSTKDTPLSTLSHNAKHSILHRFPLDVLYHLTKHHLDDTADILALRATSRSFCIPVISAGPKSTSAARSFLKRLNHDRFVRACAVEHEQQQRACSACHDVHPPRLFSTAQLARAPEERRCKGVEGVVRMCPHRTFTYDEVLRQMASGLPRGETVQTCRQCLHPVQKTAYGRKFRVRKAELASTPAEYKTTNRLSGAWVRLYLAVPTSGDSFRTTLGRQPSVRVLELVQPVLEAAQESGALVVCKHVRFRDPRTFRTRESRREWNPYPKIDYPVIYCTYDCRDPDCHMHVRVLSWMPVYIWDMALGESLLELEIARCLGHLPTPSNKRWLAQIEECEEGRSEHPSRQEL